VHLLDFLKFRAVPAAGVSIALTRRCPLHCAHCGTESTSTSEESAAEVFTRFVGTFTTDVHPEVVGISGGEAFLRPELLRDVADQSRSVGAHTFALSGMFWARTPRIPPSIRSAIDSLDHFSVSLGIFHEMEVPRSNVFRVLETLVSEGKDVSIHLVGQDGSDPYLARTVDDVLRIFEGRVPMLVNAVNYVGRAKDWLEAPRLTGRTADANPCGLAFWPVVAYDGTIVACGNDDVVEGPAPDHLRLGHAATDGWPAIRDRVLSSPMLRAIRTFGPEYLAATEGGRTLGCDGYCGTCRRLSDDPGISNDVAVMMGRPGSVAIERHAAALQQASGPVSFIRRYGLPQYAELVAVGAPS
jgi:pyruvate-formate lyase-activating enzyme